MACVGRLKCVARFWAHMDDAATASRARLRSWNPSKAARAIANLMTTPMAQLLMECPV